MKRLGKGAITLGLILGATLLLSAVAGAQEWRGGHGRLEGEVTNPKGEPIVGATVSLRLEGTGGPDLKTDKKGKWAVLGLTGGKWNVDISAPGYQTRQVSVNVSEVQRGQPVKLQLQPEVKVVPHEEISVGGKKISKETADAIKAANDAWDAKDWAASRANYEKALGELSDNESILEHLELACYNGKQYDDALKYAKKVVAVAPDNVTSWLMIAEIQLTKGNFDAGRDALAKVPDDKIVDPGPYMNMGILYYNKNKPVEAEDFFTRAIGKKADAADAYYYRGLARYQQKKSADAKADFEKYLELAPAGENAETAKELLKAMAPAHHAPAKKGTRG